jgi:hypothetical protein
MAINNSQILASRSPNIIREYCDELLSNNDHTTVEFSEAVSMLKNAVTFTGRFQRAIQPVYDELLLKFNTRITLLQQKIQELTAETTLSQLLSMEGSNPKTKLSGGYCRNSQSQNKPRKHHLQHVHTVDWN